jgi:N-methylhydantoinase B
MLNPIVIEIMWKRLISILDESAVTMMRTSFSSIIRDFHDFAIAFADSQGQIVAQASLGTPGLAGVLANGIRNFIKFFPPDTCRPGDILVTNDPWLVSGHNTDVTICVPIFYRDRLIAYNLNDVHHLDMGGRMGTYECRDAYEEGLKIPPLKIQKEGIPNEDVFAFIRHNVRVSDKVIGDIRAQIAASYTATRKLTEMIEDLGCEKFEVLTHEILDRSEKSMRERILKIPPGRYEGKIFVDSVQVEEQPIIFAVTIDVQGDEIVCDFAGTSSQVNLGVNSILEALTWCYAYFGLKSLINPEIPNNAGAFRPITIKAPKGCILNAEFPAPTIGRVAITYFIPEAIFMALKEVLPGRVIAGSGAIPLTSLTLSGKKEDGKAFLVPIALGGGVGAGKDHDGINTITFPGNVANIPIEISESEAPVLYEKKGFIPDSGGAGEKRGGLGQEVIFSIFYEGRASPNSPVLVMVRGGRFEYEVPGIWEGGNSIKAEMRINDQSIKSGKQFLLKPGDRMTIRLPGGGGFGNPLFRDLDSVLKDVQNGIVSLQGARLYGLVMDEKLTIDWEETKKLRPQNIHKGN